MSKKQIFPGDKELEGARRRLSKGPAAMPLPKNAGPVERLKHNLCAEFVKYKNSKGITQKQLAKELGINETLVSKIVNYNYGKFTVDRLIKYMSALYPNIDITLLVA